MNVLWFCFAADGGDEKRQKVEDEADGSTEAKEDAATEEKPDEAAATDVATEVRDQSMHC